MRIVDAYHTIADAFVDGRFSIRQWECYINKISPSLNAKLVEDSKSYDFSKDILPAIEYLLNHKEQAETAHASFIEATKRLARRTSAVFGTELDVTVILYLGLCNGAGWATDLDGHPAVLLGIEKIVELGWCDKRAMIALIYHELGHIWHRQVRTHPLEIATPRDKALWQLYSEGIAMYSEQLLVGDTDLYHQDKNGWLAWCKQHRYRLFVEYRRRIDQDERVQPFFGDWCQFEEHSDIGYFLGAEIIKTLSHQYSLNELADLDLHTVDECLSAMCL